MRGNFSVIVVLLAGVVCPLAGSSLASAGTFTALTCHDTAGNAVGVRGWSVGSADGGYIAFGSGCANDGQGSFGLTMGPDPTSNYFNGNGNTMSYVVPAGLSILNYSLRLNAYGGPCAIQDGQCANGFGAVWVDHTGQSDPNYDYRNLGYGAQTTVVSASELSGVSSVSVSVSCDSGQDLSYECPGAANPEARVLVSGGVFRLLDSTVPSVADVSGSLLAAGALTGSDTVSFTAMDSGGGIYSAAVLIDGQRIVWEVPDTNGGLCVNLASPSSATMVFAAPQPCPTTENLSLTVDTTQIPAGEHHLQVLVTDAAGDQETAYDGTVTIATPNASIGTTIGPGSPLSERGSANGTNAADRARLTARWAGTAKATRTSGYGALNRVSGRLTSAGGQPISGATLDVYEIPAYEGARTVRLARMRTEPTGGWALTLPRDVSSRQLRFAYTSHQNDTLPVATATLALRVRAGIALRIHPRITSIGQSIHFNGVLGGAPIPRGGKQLILEASSGGGWVQFDTLNTNAKGRYHASYRFKFPGPVSYRFRVLCPHEADFPFLKGASNIVIVHER